MTNTIFLLFRYSQLNTVRFHVISEKIIPQINYQIIIYYTYFYTSLHSYFFHHNFRIGLDLLNKKNTMFAR